jgi:hypothetical protein
MPYLSPESLPSEICTITLQIPNDELLRMAVMGQVYELTHSYLWELYGAITPAQVAAAMLTTYNDAQYCDSPCPPIGLENMIVASSTTNQSMSPTPAVVTWDAPDINTSGNFASSRLTATETSYWVIYAQAQFSISGNMALQIRKNGSTVVAESNITVNITGAMMITVLKGVLLAPNDYIEIYGFSSSSNQMTKNNNRGAFVALQVAV